MHPLESIFPNRRYLNARMAVLVKTKSSNQNKIFPRPTWCELLGPADQKHDIFCYGLTRIFSLQSLLSYSTFVVARWFVNAAFVPLFLKPFYFPVILDLQSVQLRYGSKSLQVEAALAVLRAVLPVVSFHHCLFHFSSHSLSCVQSVFSFVLLLKWPSFIILSLHRFSLFVFAKCVQVT